MQQPIISNSKTGDLLRLHPVEPDLLDLLGGISTYKIEYTSVDPDDSTVPATAFVAFPFVQRGSPFNFVAFAHGTSSIFRSCAPSTSSSLHDYDTVIPLLSSGYVVVGTDYACLGNNYTSLEYTSARANGIKCKICRCCFYDAIRSGRR